jgi:molybdopterin-guanine dinucleotide biosynthesis protein A
MSGDRTETIQPIVLVGGRSLRFGRDKLREPVSRGERGNEGAWLVDRAIGALREVFGPVVGVVGECDEEIAVRADRVIADRYRGVGPMGGIASALEETGSSVFVLPGDLCLIGGAVIPRILEAAACAPDAGAVLARTERVQWCVGIYRSILMPVFVRAIREGRTALHSAVPVDQLVTVQVRADELADADRPEDLVRSG